VPTAVSAVRPRRRLRFEARGAAAPGGGEGSDAACEPRTTVYRVINRDTGATVAVGKRAHKLAALRELRAGLKLGDCTGDNPVLAVSQNAFPVSLGPLHDTTPHRHASRLPHPL
jgi:hypothetical protein